MTINCSKKLVSPAIPLPLRPPGNHAATPYGAAASSPASRSAEIAAPLRRRLDIPIGDMRVAQGHPHVPVAEQPRDDRQRDALHDRVAGEGMAQIVEARVFQPGPHLDLVPEREVP